MPAVVYWTLVLSPKVRARPNSYFDVHDEGLNAWQPGTSNAERSGTDPDGCTKELSPFLYRGVYLYCLIVLANSIVCALSGVNGLDNWHEGACNIGGFLGIQRLFFLYAEIIVVVVSVPMILLFWSF